MTDVDALIQMLDRTRKRIYKLIEDLDAHDEIYPGWTVKQLLAHFAGWDDGSIVSLEAYAAGGPPATPAYKGINPYNAQTVAEREPLTFTHIIREWERSRDQLKEELRRLPAEKLQAEMVFPWGPTGTVEQLIYILAEHEVEHAEEIERLKKSGQIQHHAPG